MKDPNDRKSSRARRKPAENNGNGAAEVKRPARKRAAATQDMGGADGQMEAGRPEQMRPEQTRPEELTTQEMPGREVSATVPLVDERRAAQPREAEEQEEAPALDEEIRVRAYMLYCERGFEPGYDLEDWLRAEREYRERPQG